MGCFRSFKFTELLHSPYFGYVLFIVKRRYCTCNIATHAIYIVPKRANLVEEVQAVVGKEIGLLGYRLERGGKVTIDGVENIIRGASIGHNRILLYLGNVSEAR